MENKKPLSGYKHYFAVLPVELQDTAFLDRIHAFLPGWEMPKIRPDNYAQGYGFITDYLAEIFNRLRRTNYSLIVEKYTEVDGLTTRNQTAIKKTATGLLKLIHPHRDVDSIQHDEYSTCISYAVEHRSRVIEQLAVIAPEEFSKNSLAPVIRNGRQ
jgi:ATP-dependent Lon protease